MSRRCFILTMAISAPHHLFHNAGYGVIHVLLRLGAEGGYLPLRIGHELAAAPVGLGLAAYHGGTVRLADGVTLFGQQGTALALGFIDGLLALGTGLGLVLLDLRLKGLDPEARYTVERYEVFDAFQPEPPEEQPKAYSGAALLYAGLTLPRMMGDYPSVQIYLKKAKE